MSAPERFQVGDTVRCVRGYEGITEGGLFLVLSTTKCDTLRVDDTGRWWDFDRFVLVSRPTPSALDPFAWNSEVLWTASGPLAGCVNSTIAAWVAWSRFCYWATSVNLAAHFLPTVAAARTRASNGRDVPVANPERALLAALLAIDAEHVKAHDVDGCALCWPGDGSWPCTTRMETDAALEALQELDACRRALGGGGAS